MSKLFFEGLYVMVFIHCNHVLCHGQIASQETDDMGTNPKKKTQLWLNVSVLIILVILFVYSLRFNHKCRRRRRKLPHEIRLEKTNKAIRAQAKKKEEDGHISNEEYKDDIEYDDMDHGFIEHGKLWVNNINHYVQTQYDQYKDTHSQIVQDMLGMNRLNGHQQNNGDYEQIP
eukprot:11849_1